MRIPCWAFANVGQHLIDIKIDEVDSFEIIDIPIIDIPIKIYETKVDLDETLYDNFLSMFENITNYIHTENSITRIMIELYT